jgi:hypothetical protein
LAGYKIKNMFSFKRNNQKTERHVALLKCSFGDKEWYDVRVDGRLVQGGNSVSYEEAHKVYLKWISGNFDKVKTEIIQETKVDL